MSKIKYLFLHLIAIFIFACELSLDILSIFLLYGHGFFFLIDFVFFRTVLASQ